jgi:hypothetical protein
MLHKIRLFSVQKLRAVFHFLNNLKLERIFPKLPPRGLERLAMMDTFPERVPVFPTAAAHVYRTPEVEVVVGYIEDTVDG